MEQMARYNNPIPIFLQVTEIPLALITVNKFSLLLFCKTPALYAT